ncbi:MAG: phage tail tube protein [Brevundimonas sp.]|uniref:phage tail tube protein n=1 Tax=Brevundimonas sp. TaxID=1871086 RepID=UPI002733619B|nr:phage tail tube protein [Brevundimonas sp.]MDP3405049.1 phage tail tube protein [Brevundimonas sp.]
MARARGANGLVAGAFSTTGYAGIPTSGFRLLPVVSLDLGEDQGIMEDDLLGLGRDPQDGGDDVIVNEGQAVVPVDLRNFGFWLKLMLGAPTTGDGIAAFGSISFSAQPANNATVTIGGTAVTFVTGTPTAGQVKIGATLEATINALLAVLNTSADAGIAAATYGALASGRGIAVFHKTLGTSGNSFTLAAGTSPASAGTVSGATLSGGAASGGHRHVFVGGKLDHPDAALQIGMPEVPHYGMNYGVMGNNMSIQMQRSGMLNATLDLIAQGENTGAASMAGSLETAWVVERFSQFAGVVEADGVPLGKVESTTLRIANNLDKDESIRPDGRIGGADPAKLAVSLDITVRFADRVMHDKATARTPITVRLAWQISPTKRLEFVMSRVRLPRRKAGLTGPNGIRVTFPGVATKASNGETIRAVLINDVAAY